MKNSSVLSQDKYFQLPNSFRYKGFIVKVLMPGLPKTHQQTGFCCGKKEGKEGREGGREEEGRMEGGREGGRDGREGGEGVGGKERERERERERPTRANKWKRLRI
jgi:hypothetical protein